MTGSEVAVRQTVQMSTEQLQYIANTEFMPRGLRGNMPAILACVATGRELGIGDMMALKSIHIIDGSPSYSAELMVMLVRRAGHSIKGEVSEDAATVVGTRADNGDTMKVTWTLAMAERAELVKKQNWRSYPSAMLWARAVSQLCRMLFADCFAGATYTTEELGEADTGADASPAPIEDDYLFPPVSPETGEMLAAGSAGEPTADESRSDSTVPQAAVNEPASPAEDVTPATVKQKKKLDVLVGKLRPEHISTEQLWQAHFLDPANGLGEDGEVHWSPLRERLTFEQATRLIDRLSALEARVAKPAFEVPESARG